MKKQKKEETNMEERPRKLKLIAIRDKKADFFTVPDCIKSVAMAERYLKTTLPENSIVRKFPKDFELYEIGEYDETTGIIEGRLPNKICDMEEIFKEEESQK